MCDGTFAVGDSVFLRGCRVGEPGRVIRLERGKIVIHWVDLDYIGRHSPASLIAAIDASKSPASPQVRAGSEAQSIHSTYAGREFSDGENPVQPKINNTPIQETIQWQP